MDNFLRTDYQTTHVFAPDGIKESKKLVQS